ncbi:MAG TPA: nucleotide exchange factor GrpE [Candidatus Nanoarchaeia archaeon]|nr:nucleotide exchange factor GrpE [Candidatus Nanoarchaeia archaeon]
MEGKPEEKETENSEKELPKTSAEIDTVPRQEYLELKELLQRTQANLENYRKQTEKRVEEINKMAARNIILQILPVVDNLELGLNSAKDNPNKDTIVQGLELIRNQINKILMDNGVEVIEALQKKFDPYMHEALMKTESKEEKDTVIEIFQKGYTLKGNVIRPAKVKISAGKK